MKFIHITDTHLTGPGKRLYDLDPHERLQLCIEDINRNHADAAFAIVTGDLAHVGEIAAYRALRRALETLCLKTYLLLGNHDSRRNFLEVFPESPRDVNGFVQFAFDTPIGRFVCIDSNEPDVPWGVVCEPRLTWLAAELEAAAGRPVYLFVHHPPFPVGLKRMDEISLQEPEKFAAVVAGHDIRHLFFGHLHRPIAGSWRGIPFTTMRGTNHQVALDFVMGGVVPGSHEPPAYAVVNAGDDLTVVHFHDYLDKTGTFIL